MLKSRNMHAFSNGLKYSISSTIKCGKWMFLTITLLSLLSLGVGIFIAIKNNNDCSLSFLREVDVGDFYTGFVGPSSAFFSRCLSLFVNIAILVILSFSPFMFPLACALFCFRAYLLGLNIALVFIFYGIGAIMSTLVVIVPCQILSLAVLIVFYLVLEKSNQNFKKFGCRDVPVFRFTLLILCLLLLINLAETILLFILRGSVILVI